MSNSGKLQLNKNLPWIDALRGLAIFGVLAYHVVIVVKDLPPPVKLIIEQGESGVQLFYLVSAFTLFWSMNNRSQAESSPIFDFFVRRFFRIAPLFYCAIAYYILKDGIGPSYWVDDGKSITIPNIISHLTFTNGWNPYWINTLVPVGWSVAIEMPFYLLVPFLFKRIKSINQAVWLTFIAFIVSKFLSFILKKFPLVSDPNLLKDFLYYWLPNQLPYFFLGIIFYFLIFDTWKNSEESNFPSALNYYRKAMTPLVLLGLFMVGLSVTTTLTVTVTSFFYGIGFVGLAFWLAHNSFPLLVNQFWCYLGKISYSAYLIHIEIVELTKFLMPKALSALNLTLPPLINLIVLLGISLAGTMALSTLTYRYIEKPGMALGRHIIAQREAKLREGAS